MKKIYILILLALSFNALGMPIFIETPNNGTITLDVEPSDNIENIKANIQISIGMDPVNQILKFNGITLNDGSTLADNNITSGNTIQLTDATLGFTNIELSSNKLYLYPNPSKNFVQISGLTDNQNYRIFNVLGTKIGNGIVSENEKIDIKNLINGLYFLILDNSKILKFIKE